MLHRNTSTIYEDFPMSDFILVAVMVASILGANIQYLL